LDVAVELGADRERLLAEAGLREGDLRDSERAPAAALGLLIDAALRHTGDEALMMWVAKAVTKHASGIVVHLAYSCELLADTLRVLVRHFAFCCDLVIPAVVLDERVCTITFVPAADASYISAQAQDALTEAASAILLLHLRNAAGVPLRPLEVTFRHKPPTNVVTHSIAFGLVPQFRAEQDALRFTAKTVELPCAHPDEELRSVLEPYAEMLLTRHHRDVPYTRRTLDAVRELLSQGEPRIQDVASGLHVSLRSLQRRLREENTSFSEIVDTVRQEMAMTYLEQPELSASEIAERLGFADVSSFHRAFRRWTGLTVCSFRRRG
jgi:AraC-like DNA-binding protein